MISFSCMYKGHNYGPSHRTSLRYCLRYNCRHQQYYDKRRGWVDIPCKPPKLASLTH